MIHHNVQLPYIVDIYAGNISMALLESTMIKSVPDRVVAGQVLTRAALAKTLALFSVSMLFVNYRRRGRVVMSAGHLDHV